MSKNKKGDLKNYFLASIGADKNGKTQASHKQRLEYLRQELRAERLSYGEIAELQSLAKYIEPSDVELLEAAGIPEFKQKLCAGCFNEKAERGDFCKQCAQSIPE